MTSFHIRRAVNKTTPELYLSNVHLNIKYFHYAFSVSLNPFTADPVKALHFAILVQPSLIFDIWALWRSGMSARAPKCQKLKIEG